MKNYQSLIDQVSQSEEFQKLSKIGGHKVYHLEGNALQHTQLVVSAAERRFGKGHFMVLVALLHDIGKIYTSVCNGPDDWSYPHHSDGGAKRLSNFISEDMPEFKAIQWYIFNHIRPLFWMGKDMNTEIELILKSVPEDGKSYCNISWLRDLALCDLEGSKSVKPQTQLIEFLQDLKL